MNTRHCLLLVGVCAAAIITVFFLLRPSSSTNGLEPKPAYQGANHQVLLSGQPGESENRDSIRAVRQKSYCSGVVVDAHSRALLVGVELQVDSAESRPVFSDSLGCWSLDVDRASSGHVVLELQGYLPRKVLLSDLEMAGTVLRLWRSGVLTIQSKDMQGEPIDGCLMNVHSTGAGPTVSRVPTNNGGIAEISGLPCGEEVRVSAQFGGQLVHKRIVIPVATGVASIDVQFLRTECDLVGQLLWEDGAPVTTPGRIVRFRRQGIRRATGLDSDGRFTLSRLPAGSANLLVQSSAMIARKVNLRGGVLDIGIIRIPRLGVVSGTVRGSGDPSAMVVEAIQDKRTIARCEVAEDMTFHFELPQRETKLAIRLETAPHGYWIASKVVACPSTEVVLDLESTLGWISWSTADSIGNATVVAISGGMNELGIPPGVQGRWMETLKAERAGDAGWRAGPLGSGTYDFYIGNRNGPGYWKRDVRVNTGQTTTLGKVAMGMGSLLWKTRVDHASSTPEPLLIRSVLHPDVFLPPNSDVKLPPGPWQVMIEAPGDDFPLRPYLDVFSGTSSQFEWGAQDLGRVAGVLVGLSGQSDRASIELGLPVSFSKKEPRDSTKCGEDGRFAFEGVLPGTYALRVSVGDVHVQRTIEVCAAETTQCEFDVEPGKGRSIVVVAPEVGTPLVMGRVYALAHSGSLYRCGFGGEGAVELPIPPEQVTCLLVGESQATRSLGNETILVYRIARLEKESTHPWVARIQDGQFSIKGDAGSAFYCYIRAVDRNKVQPLGGFGFALEVEQSGSDFVTVSAPPGQLDVFVREIKMDGTIVIHGPHLAKDMQLH